MKLAKSFLLSDTSPAAASTVVGSSLGGLTKYDALRIDVNLLGATGGTLDVYIQRKIASNVWADWAHFTQLTTASAAKMWSLYTTDTTGSLTAIGVGTDAAPGVVLAANSFVGGMPGSDIRMVYVAGASTSAGAAQLIYVTAFQRQA